VFIVITTCAELQVLICSLLWLLLPMQGCRCQSVHCYYYLWGVAGANLFIIITTCAGLQVPICSLLLLPAGANLFIIITTCAGLQVLVAIHYSVLDARNGYIRNVVV